MTRTQHVNEILSIIVGLLCILYLADLASNGGVRRLLSQAQQRASQSVRQDPVRMPTAAELTALHAEARRITREAATGV